MRRSCFKDRNDDERERRVSPRPKRTSSPFRGRRRTHPRRTEFHIAFSHRYAVSNTSIFCLRLCFVFLLPLVDFLSDVALTSTVLIPALQSTEICVAGTGTYQGGTFTSDGTFCGQVDVYASSESSSAGCTTDEMKSGPSDGTCYDLQRHTAAFFEGVANDVCDDDEEPCEAIRIFSQGTHGEIAITSCASREDTSTSACTSTCTVPEPSVGTTSCTSCADCPDRPSCFASNAGKTASPATSQDTANNNDPVTYDNNASYANDVTFDVYVRYALEGMNLAAGDDVVENVRQALGDAFVTYATAAVSSGFASDLVSNYADTTLTYNTDASAYDVLVAVSGDGSSTDWDDMQLLLNSVDAALITNDDHLDQIQTTIQAYKDNDVISDANDVTFTSSAAVTFNGTCVGENGPCTYASECCGPSSIVTNDDLSCISSTCASPSTFDNGGDGSTLSSSSVICNWYGDDVSGYCASSALTQGCDWTPMFASNNLNEECPRALENGLYPCHVDTDSLGTTTCTQRTVDATTHDCSYSLSLVKCKSAYKIVDTPLQTTYFAYNAKGDYDTRSIVNAPIFDDEGYPTSTADMCSKCTSCDDQVPYECGKRVFLCCVCQLPISTGETCCGTDDWKHLGSRQCGTFVDTPLSRSTYVRSRFVLERDDARRRIRGIRKVRCRPPGDANDRADTVVGYVCIYIYRLLRFRAAPHLSSYPRPPPRPQHTNRTHRTYRERRHVQGHVSTSAVSRQHEFGPVLPYSQRRVSRAIVSSPLRRVQRAGRQRDV